MPLSPRPSRCRAAQSEPARRVRAGRTLSALARTLRGLTAAALGSLAVGTASCSPTNKPCLVPRDCDHGYECLANSCRVTGVDPVHAHSLRVVLDPIQVHVVGSTSDGSSVLLGGASRADAHVLIGYDVATMAQLGADRLERAHLLFEEPRLPPASSDRVAIVLERLIDPWDAQSVSAGIEPRRALDATRGLVQPGSSGRVDVTALLRDWLRAPEQSHGFALAWAEGGPLLLSTVGAFARLEGYFRPPEGHHD